jgi:hypothetical protein
MPVTMGSLVLTDVVPNVSAIGPQEFDNAIVLNSVQVGITARAGGGQALATLLTGNDCQVTTVASANDSVILPVSTPGLDIYVTNAAAANSMNVYAQGTDTINAIAASSPLAVAAGKSVCFHCPVVGKWYAILSA